MQVIVFGGIGSVILYFMWQSQGNGLLDQCALDGRSGDECKLSAKLLKDFQNANWIWLAMVCGAYMLSNTIRAMRWRDMLSTLGYRVSLFNSIAAVMVGYFANLGVPRLGEILRPSILARYEDVAIEKAFGTIVLERIVDVILLALLIALGFVFHYESLGTYISENSSVTSSQLIISISVMAVIGLGGLALLAKLLKMEEEGMHPIILKIKKLVNGFIEGIVSIRKLENLPKFIFQSIAIWALYFLMHYWAFQAFDPTSHLSAIDTILVFDFGSLGIVLPSPGGMGTYHFLIVESLNILKVNPIAGFSFAMIIFFTINIGCNVIFGLISLIALPIVNKK